jgi:5,10-methylenetetrahydromethanopterin reductase
MDLKLGLGLFWYQMTYDEMVALIEEAEALGYSQIWADNEKFFHYMYVTATVIAEHTQKVQIGTFVADPYVHHPAITAMAIGSLDEVSHGRASLVMGAGGTGMPEMGIVRRKPALAIKEAIHVIRGLWAGETVDFHGEVIQFNKGKLHFQARPDIPIYVASRGDLVLQTAGEVADGVMIATYAQPAGIQHALDMVKVGADRCGRSLEDLKIISRVDTCISKDRKKAYDALRTIVMGLLWLSYPDRKFVHYMGLEVPKAIEEVLAQRDYNLMLHNTHLVPDEFIDTFCWGGTPEEVAEKVYQVAQMGIENITFLPHSLEGESVEETVRAFATIVKPMVEKALGE